MKSHELRLFDETRLAFPAYHPSPSCEVVIGRLARHELTRGVGYSVSAGMLVRISFYLPLPFLPTFRIIFAAWMQWMRNLDTD
ncbi:hypothetical protein BDQ94DRAFT_24861 [Aspergillus welwitschiae]|uniref:Uncharacterized protein n=1 Tax=Aspergillus welwitschiae TaxID=1341132 RepID=A0A3F3Q4Y6_9EURO|nr:hypothetical protein BDQ94DRAFT_24861 [Aspergillus welwitschiae]RDH34279.1 hypothetical protein BDQ94DRAFT_24861 [Aspergillus welwitschiae]